MAQVFLVMTAGGVNTADPSTWPLDRAIISHDGEVTGLTNGVDYFAVAASEASPVFSPFHPAVFSPLALWDLSDHSTVFQDAMGTVPTGVGDPVRYISDLSGNGNHIVTSINVSYHDSVFICIIYFLHFQLLHLF